MDASIGLTHFTSAAIVVYAMNKLKAAKWFPIVQEKRVTLNRAFSVTVAFFVAIGIHYTWSAGAGGGHQLVLEIPSVGTLALGVWHWLNQYALQETVYHATKGPEPVKP